MFEVIMISTPIFTEPENQNSSTYGWTAIKAIFITWKLAYETHTKAEIVLDYTLNKVC